MEKNSLAHKTLKNASYSFMNYGWGLLFALFITPIIVFKLGVDNYGVYIFVNILANVIGLVELGVSTAVAKYVAEYYGAKQEEKLRRLLYSANSLFSVIGLIGLLAFVGVGYLGQYFISADALQVYNIQFLLFIAGLNFLVGAIGGIFPMLPPALQRFDLSSKIGMAQLAASSLGVLAAIMSGGGLIAVFLVQLSVTVVFVFIYYFYSHRLLPIARLSFFWDKAEIWHCYKFALVAFISNISGQTLAYFDKLIIPIFINPASLSYYSLAGSVASKSTGSLNSLTSVLFPAVSHLQGSDDQESIKRLYVRSFRLTTILNAAITLAISFFAYKIMQYWLDESFAIKASGVLMVLAATYFFVSLYSQLTNFLLGLGRTKILAAFSSSMAIINIVLLFIFLPRYGIMGAAWAYLISLLPTIYIFYYIEKRLFNLENRLAYYAKLFFKIILTGIVFYFLCTVLISPLIVGFKTLMLFGPLAVLLYLVLYRVFGFYDRADLKTLKDFWFLVLEKLSRKKYAEKAS